MRVEQVSLQAKKLLSEVEGANDETIKGLLAQAYELFRKASGEKNAFNMNLSRYFGRHSGWAGNIKSELTSNLKAFISETESGMLSTPTLQRQAQIDVVSDFLSQAQNLLENKKIHAAVPTIIIGAALEEFLRNLVEEQGYSLAGRKPSVESYASTLKEKGRITKQDKKDIDSWGGKRNHAAHAEWEEVSDPDSARNMLDGVNLFMRKYTTV